MHMQTHAVCFDMDGVIIDSEPIHYQSFKQTIAAYGLTLTNALYQQYFSGKTDRQGFEDFFMSVNQHCNIDALLRRRARAYKEIASTSLKGYSETLSVIRQLSPVMKLALVTSSTRSDVEFVLKRFELEACFSVIVTADDVTNGKPDPEAYLLAAKRLQVDPAQCTVIEDSPSGVRAAKRAGMRCLALRTTHTEIELRLADRVVTHLSVDDLT